MDSNKHGQLSKICPCGSGKQFRDCHGQIDGDDQPASTDRVATSTQVATAEVTQVADGLHSPATPNKHRKCSVCGADYPPDVRFCPRDGATIEDEVTEYAGFISYRRDGGANTARLIKLMVEKYSDKKLFLDVDELGTGRFDDRLLRIIETVPNFILILSPGCLDRCVNDDDWLKREILHALSKKRNIIPIMVDGFAFPSREFLLQLPPAMAHLPSYQGVAYEHQYAQASVLRILRHMNEISSGPERHASEPDTRGSGSLQPFRPSLATANDASQIPTESGSSKSDNLAFVRELLKHNCIKSYRQGVPEAVIAQLTAEQRAQAVPGLCHELTDCPNALERLTALWLLIKFQNDVDTSTNRELIVDATLRLLCENAAEHPDFRQFWLRGARLMCERMVVRTEIKLDLVLRHIPNAIEETSSAFFSLLQAITPPAKRRFVCQALSEHFYATPWYSAGVIGMFETYDYYEGRGLLIECLPRLRPGTSAWLSLMKVLSKWKVVETRAYILRTLTETNEEPIAAACLEYVELNWRHEHEDELAAVARQSGPQTALWIGRLLRRLVATGSSIAEESGRGAGHGSTLADSVGEETAMSEQLASLTHTPFALGPDPLEISGLLLQGDLLFCEESERIGFMYRGKGPALPLQVTVEDAQEHSATTTVQLPRSELRWLDVEFATIHRSGQVDLRRIVLIKLCVFETRSGEELVITGSTRGGMPWPDDMRTQHGNTPGASGV